MADFASFKQVESDRPLIINLDTVVAISVTYGDNYDDYDSYEANIQFHNSLEGSDEKPIHELPAVMVWRFNSKVAGPDSGAIQAKRDQVLKGLLGKERVFIAAAKPFFGAS